LEHQLGDEAREDGFKPGFLNLCSANPYKVEKHWAKTYKQRRCMLLNKKQEFKIELGRKRKKDVIKKLIF